LKITFSFQISHKDS